MGLKYQKILIAAMEHLVFKDYYTATIMLNRIPKNYWLFYLLDELEEAVSCKRELQFYKNGKKSKKLVKIAERVYFYDLFFSSLESILKLDFNNKDAFLFVLALIWDKGFNRKD